MSGTYCTPQSLLTGQAANLPTDVIVPDPLPDVGPADDHISQMLQAQEAEKYDQTNNARTSITGQRKI